MSNGKGDKTIQKTVSYKTWDKNYNRIFRRGENVKTNKKSKK